MSFLNFDHFEWISPVYDRFFKLEDPDRIIKLIDLPIQGKILDAGGGTGRVSQALVDFAGSIVIADQSFGMLKQASRKNGLNTVCAVTEKLPFHTETFDRILMIDALHHVVNHQETLKELWRVVSPGGKIVIEEPDIRKLSVKILALVEKILLMRSHFISPVRIANLFNFHRTSVEIVQDGYTAWVVIEKTRSV